MFTENFYIILVKIMVKYKIHIQNYLKSLQKIQKLGKYVSH